MKLLTTEVKIYIAIFLGFMTFGVVSELVHPSFKYPEEMAAEACEMFGYSLATTDSKNKPSVRINVNKSYVFFTVTSSSASVSVNGVSYQCK